VSVWILQLTVQKPVGMPSAMLTQPPPEPHSSVSASRLQTSPGALPGRASSTHSPDQVSQNMSDAQSSSLRHWGKQAPSTVPSGWVWLSSGKQEDSASPEHL